MASAANGLTRIIQQDFSGGMFPELAPELIPPNGCFDITNGLLNEQDVVYRRGGTLLASTDVATGPVRMLWSGRLKAVPAGQANPQTILAVENAVYRLEPAAHPGGPVRLVALPVKAPDELTIPTAFQGKLYFGNGSAWDGATAEFATSPRYLATCANRLLRGEGSRIDVASIPTTEGGGFAFSEDAYFSLPEGAEILGMRGWRTSCVVFTTRGIWLLGGLVHAEPVDENGNIQWSQDLYSADAVLWGEPGVAAWKGGLVVPCRDDVWLMELGVSSEKAAPFVAISQPIRRLYRQYVAEGCVPGAACVYNGHYFLPVLKEDTVVDLLVCRLEGVGASAPAWTHLKGWGAEVAAITPSVSDIEGPLLGARGGAARVLKLAYLEPSVAAEKDANEEDVAFSVTTRSIATGNLTPNTVVKARLSYRMSGAGLMKLAVGSTPYGAQWGAFNWGEAAWSAASGPFAALSDPHPEPKSDPEGVKPVTWRVGRKVRFVRMQISLDGPASECSIRMLELFVRLDGRVI